MHLLNDWIHFGIITNIETVSFFHNVGTFNQVIKYHAEHTRAWRPVGEWFEQKVTAVANQLTQQTASSWKLIKGNAIPMELDTL